MMGGGWGEQIGGELGHFCVGRGFGEPIRGGLGPFFDVFDVLLRLTFFGPSRATVPVAKRRAATVLATGGRQKKGHERPAICY